MKKFVRRHRFGVAAASVVPAALVLGVIGTTVGMVRARQETCRSEASKLVALGDHELGSDPTAALAYAIRSLELADIMPARLLALRVLQQAPVARDAVVRSSEEGVDRVFAKQVDFSPSGDWVAIGSFVKSEVLRRDGKRSLFLGDYQSAGETSFEVRFTPQSDALVANLLGEIRVWSIPEGRELLCRRIDEGPSSLVMDDDSSLTLTDVEESTVIRRWPVSEGEPQLVGTMDPLGPHDVARGTLAFARGPMLFLRSLENWNARPRGFAEHPADIVDVALSPDAALLATSDRSGTIRIWNTDAKSRAPQWIFEGEGTPWLRFDPHGVRLSARGVVDGYRTIRLWDLRVMPAAEPITLVRDVVQMNGLAFDSTGDWLATAHTSKVAFWWLGGEYPRVLRVDAEGGLLEFTPDGRSLISSFTDGTVRAWSLVAGSAAEPTVLLRDDRLVFPDLAVDPSGRNIAVGGAEGRIHLVPLDGGPTRMLEGFSNRVRVGAMGFDGEGRLLAAATYIGPAEEKVIRVFDLDTGDVRVLGPVPGAGDGLIGGAGGFRTRLSFVGRDRILAPVAGIGIVSFDLKTGATSIVTPWPRAWAWPTAVSVGVGLTGPPSSDWEPTHLIRFRLDDSAPEELFTHGPAALLRAAAFDRTEQFLATGSADGIVRVGPASGEEPHLLLGHTARIRGLAFSPDGRWLASGAVDGTIRIWPVPDVSRPPPHTLPLDKLLAKLHTQTNVRAVPDPASPTGYKLEVGPFPGWATPPEW